MHAFWTKNDDMTVKSVFIIAVTLLCYKLLFAQTPFPYAKTWKKIDSLLQKKDLPKSALEEVNKLYAAAKKEKEEAQWVKAVIYMGELQNATDGDITKSSLRFEEEIQSAPARVAALLRSLEAEELYRYLQQQRYRLADKKEVQNDSSEDIGTWTSGRLNKKIRELYLASLKDEKLLKQTNLAPFDVIILKGNARNLRPTLYDLLVYRALMYFENDDPEQPLAEDAFMMNDPACFLPAARFSEYTFKGSDSLSNHLTALKLFQSLLKFHAADAKPDAEIDADINRISFVNRYAMMPEKDSLYFSTLRQITGQYSSLPVAAQAWYLQAAFYSQKAASFDPVNDTANRFDYVKAKAICEQVLTQKDSSEGKTNCSSLLRNITHLSFTLETEKVNLPDLPFRALVSYKNVHHIYARIIRIDDATRDDLGNNGWDEKIWKKLLRFPIFRRFDQAFPETKDFQQHRVEIKVDPLPLGQYALFTSTDSSFSETAVLAVQYFFCSSIAFVNHGGDYFVADRNTGAPLADVKVQTLNQVYDSRQQKDVYRKSKWYKTDSHGFFRLQDEKTNRYYGRRLEFYNGKDFLSASDERIYRFSNVDSYANLNAREYEKKMLQDILFTDRSIYRPGQTVYYKGLLLTKDYLTKKYKIAENVKVKLYLLDANDQPLDSAIAIPDDFGSFHGNFRLPDNLLTGSFSIKDSLTEDDRDFPVEEYKRPKFYVEYDPVKGSYSTGDSVHVSGTATGYAGNKISGSKFSYRVFRESRFPYPWYFRRIPSAAEQEITHGEGETDADGKFNIDFPALADPGIKKETRPVFSYRIETDITDLNGETRSATTTVAASYQSFQIISSLPAESRMESDSLQEIPLTTQNASGEFLPQLVTVSVFRLKTPDRLIRKRYWDQPDQFVMSKADYIKSFPNDEYQDETDKASWERLSKLLEKTDSTRATGSFTLDSKKLSKVPDGWFLVEFRAKDKNGEIITDKRYVELTGNANDKTGYPVYNTIESDDQTSEPGKELNIKTGSSATDVFVIRAREDVNDSLSTYSYFRLNDEIKSTALKVEEKDRGGFAVNDVFIKNNRWYSSNHIIHVPWTNKELKISYETWRDKTLPGSAEKWKVRISGYKKNRVTAEVLTAMYDASLDQFKKHSWELPDLYPLFTMENSWAGVSNFNDAASMVKSREDNQAEYFSKQYDRLISSVQTENLRIRGISSIAHMQLSPAAVGNLVMRNEQNKLQDSDKGLAAEAKFTPPKIGKDEGSEEPGQSQETRIPNTQIRKNFNETAFFFPDLKTDAEGNVEISFTMPEALTQWKWMIFAYTKDLAFGYAEKSVITQKELMLQPNMPRFFREGDTMQLPVKISNLSAEAMTGTVQLDWLDAAGNSNQNIAFQNRTASQPFRVGAGQSTMVSFPTVIPTDFQQPVLYRLQAKTNTASDGEENMIPVLSNRMLVTETIPLNLAGRNNLQVSWKKLLESGSGSTLKSQSLTLEFTTNPAWYAVQSLPYLMEFPYECAEQTFNRFYANALAAQIINSSPGIEAVFEKWKNLDSAALLSNLQKNQELKTVLLRETPWVLEAQNENQQKKNLALLFDVVRMSRELKSTLDKLKLMQSEGGGFPWFKGGRDDRYITQYIISGIGHLKKLGAVPDGEQPVLDQITKAGIAWLDKMLKTEYDHRPKKADENISATQVQYLYMRSFFPEIGLPGSVFPAMNYYRKQAVQYWTKQNMYLRGMIALFLYRTGDRKTAKDIIASLKENATQSEEMGMYWPSVKPGYYWQESPVETQSLLIEAFHEIDPDLKLADQMKYWLLRQKQTRHWGNTKATADACYALLLNGGNWLAAPQDADISLGDYTVHTGSERSEAGTGYLKKVIPGDSVQPSMGNIRVVIHPESGKAVSPSWGAVYWQYFENLNKITAAASTMSVYKALYIQKNTGGGPVLEPVTEGNILKPGDKLVMRIIIKSDRDLEYVHLKDMRAACLEPLNVLSGYRWQGGLGYYESTKDESSSFFFDYLPKGTHVFEYPLFVTTPGTYSNGISELQCMYAPEFAAHTEGVRIHVAGK